MYKVRNLKQSIITAYVTNIRLSSWDIITRQNNYLWNGYLRVGSGLARVRGSGGQSSRLASPGIAAKSPQLWQASLLYVRWLTTLHLYNTSFPIISVLQYFPEDRSKEARGVHFGALTRSSEGRIILLGGVAGACSVFMGLYCLLCLL